jgi:hypothetical protein
VRGRKHAVVSRESAVLAFCASDALDNEVLGVDITDEMQVVFTTTSFYRANKAAFGCDKLQVVDSLTTLELRG